VAQVSEDHPELYLLRAIDRRYTTSFRYGQMDSPFEYEKVRYVYTEARKLQIRIVMLTCRSELARDGGSPEPYSGTDTLQSRASSLLQQSK
jgi:ABC-type transporter lipoprotein component MlaA